MSQLPPLARDLVKSYGLHITTKFLGATNYKPSRVKATCCTPWGKVTATNSWSHEGDASNEHYNAALAVCAKLAEQNQYVTRYDITGMAFDDGSPGYFFIATGRFESDQV